MGAMPVPHTISGAACRLAIFRLLVKAGAAVDADDKGIGRKAGKGGRGILHQIRRTVLVIMM